MGRVPGCRGASPPKCQRWASTVEKVAYLGGRLAPDIAAMTPATDVSLEGVFAVSAAGRPNRAIRARMVADCRLANRAGVIAVVSLLLSRKTYSCERVGRWRTGSGIGVGPDAV